ncbi:MAG: anacyclamide/piricyclamide family prenylated cyclic peptide [Gloeotrichia echinulata GP01]
MTKKNLRPQQAAPIARETTSTSSQQGQVTPSFIWDPVLAMICQCIPFAGDDAE